MPSAAMASDGHALPAAKSRPGSARPLVPAGRLTCNHGNAARPAPHVRGASSGVRTSPGSCARGSRAPRRSSGPWAGGQRGSAREIGGSAGRGGAALQERERGLCGLRGSRPQLCALAGRGGGAWAALGPCSTPRAPHGDCPWRRGAFCGPSTSFFREHLPEKGSGLSTPGTPTSSWSRQGGVPSPSPLLSRLC